MKYFILFISAIVGFALCGCSLISLHQTNGNWKEIASLRVATPPWTFARCVAFSQDNESIIYIWEGNDNLAKNSSLSSEGSFNSYDIKNKKLRKNIQRAEVSNYPLLQKVNILMSGNSLTFFQEYLSTMLTSRSLDAEKMFEEMCRPNLIFHNGREAPPDVVWKQYKIVDKDFDFFKMIVFENNGSYSESEIPVRHIGTGYNYNEAFMEHGQKAIVFRYTDLYRKEGSKEGYAFFASQKDAELGRISGTWLRPRYEETGLVYWDGGFIGGNCFVVVGNPFGRYTFGGRFACWVLTVPDGKVIAEFKTGWSMLDNYFLDSNAVAMSKNGKYFAIVVGGTLKIYDTSPRPKE